MDKLVNQVATVRRTLNSLFYKFADEIDASLTAVLARENFILIGPPGTAKTMLVSSTSKLLKAKWFYRLLTKFTEIEEVIGPIDVVELLRGNVKRIYANSIVEADLALLDEIFNASSAILNTMLTILNERVVYDGGSIIPVKTWIVFGATNRIPDEEELQALYDRFPLRVFTKYAQPDETEELIKTGLRLRQRYDQLTPAMSMDDVKKLNEYIQSYVYENIDGLVKHIAPVVASYLDHIEISNRTRVKIPLYVMAYLTVAGIEPASVDSPTLRAGVLKTLKYLVRDREDLAEYESFLATHMPGNLSTLYDLVNEIKALVANNAVNIARERLREAYNILEREIADAVTYRFFYVELEELRSTLEMLKSQL